MEAPACLERYKKMLIKKRKLVSISGSTDIVGVLQPQHGEINRALQGEIQKIKQEAKQIKNEAQLILSKSEKTLKEAETKAKQIVSDANLEAKNIKERVYKETMQAAAEEAELIKEQAKAVLKELFEVKREALTKANKEIIKVALDLAEKIIRYKVTVDPNILQTQVIEAIKKATSEADRVQVFVNPDDLKTLEESIPQMEKLFPSGVDIVPLASDSVDSGSCIVETKSGQLDARFSTQLQALTDLMNHIEVIEPQIEVDEEIPDIKSEQNISIQEVSGEVKQEEIIHVIEDEEKLTEIEKEVLEKELLAENPFPFISNEQLISPTSSLELEEDLQQEQEIINIPDEVVQNIEQHVVEDEEPSIKPEGTFQQKKKLSVTPIEGRTKEEAEELDEGLVFEYEDEELEEKKEEEIKPVNILKPKKSKSSEVSNIASELEANPEWKNLVEEGEE